MPPDSTLNSSEAVPMISSQSLLDSEEEEPLLPYYKCINPRCIVKPEQIDLNKIAHKSKAIHIGKQHQKADQIHPVSVPKTAIPLPKFPLTLMWNPAIINFELQCDRVVNRLRLFNSCIRPIFIQIYGLWDQTARLGASWCWTPKTRIFLAPGMISYLAITATPREESPIPLAHIGLQLTATHMRDMVVGCFVVPMEVKFLNFKKISSTNTELSETDLNHADTSSPHDDGKKSTLLVTDTEGSTFNK